MCMKREKESGQLTVHLSKLFERVAEAKVQNQASSTLKSGVSWGNLSSSYPGRKLSVTLSGSSGSGKRSISGIKIHAACEYTVSIELLERYKTLKASHRLKIQVARKLYHDNTMRNSLNKNQTAWNIIKQHTGGSRTDNQNLDFRKDDGSILACKDLADAFNNYFLESVQALTQNININSGLTRVSKRFQADIVAACSTAASAVMLETPTSPLSDAAFLTDLSLSNLDDIYLLNNIDDKVDHLTAILTDIFNKHAPLRIVRVNKPHAPWLNDDLRKTLKEKDRLFSLYKANKTEQNLTKFKKARNAALLKIRNEKKAYLEQLSREKNDSKELWTGFRHFNVNSRTKPVIPDYINDPDQKTPPKGASISYIS
nr:unnamed protein product [Callosobruchus chinensis]